MIVWAPPTPPLGAPMSIILTALALLAAPSAHASQSIDMSVNLKTVATYEATSTTSFRMKSGTGTASMHIAIHANGINQAQDMPSTTAPESGGSIEILSPNQIRLTGNADSSVVLSATISADGSIRVKSSEMKRGMRTLVKDQLVALQNQLAGKGEVNLSLAAPDLVCKAHARELNCNYGAAISVHVEAQ
jgi:hypothetical protein